MTLTLCTSSIEILTVGSVPFPQILILLDLVLNVALQRMSSRAKWSMAMTSMMSSSQFLSLNCMFSVGVIPNTGCTWRMGVSLSEDLSSIDVNRSWGVLISGSSAAQSC